MSDLLVVFQGIHQTLNAEYVLEALGVKTTLVPTPPAVSLGCGFSILSPDSCDPSFPEWWYSLEKPRVLYRIIQKEGHKEYEEIDRCEGTCLPPAGDLDSQCACGGETR